MLKRSFIKTFILALVIVLLIGLSGGITSFDKQWYEASKPSFAPPNYLFGIVWPILYILIALSLTLAWTNATKKQRKSVLTSYGINLIANAIWTGLFFGLKMPLLAFADIVLIWGTIIAMMVVSYKIDKRACWLLLPYLLWVSFAAILNLSFI